MSTKRLLSLLLLFIIFRASENDYALMLLISPDPGFLFDSPDFQSIIITEKEAYVSDESSLWHFPNNHKAALLSNSITVNIHFTISTVLTFTVRNIFITEKNNDLWSLVSSLSNLCIPNKIQKSVIRKLNYDKAKDGHSEYNLFINVSCILFTPIRKVSKNSYQYRELGNAYEVDHSDLEISNISAIDDSLNKYMNQIQMDEFLQNLSEAEIIKRLKIISYHANRLQQKNWEKHFESQNQNSSPELII